MVCWMRLQKNLKFPILPPFQSNGAQVEDFDALVDNLELYLSTGDEEKAPTAPTTGWVRDLTEEGIEPNPGWTWKQVIDELPNILDADYTEELKKFREVLCSTFKIKSPTSDHIIQHLGSDILDDGLREGLRQAISNLGKKEDGKDPAVEFERVIGSKLSSSEKNLLYVNFSNYLVPLSQGLLGEQVIRDTYRQIQLFAKTSTRKIIEKKEGIIIGTKISASGQTKSIFYGFMDSRPVCVKIYVSATESDLEVNASKQIHSLGIVKNIVLIEQSFDLSNNRKALVMPLFSKSLQDLLALSPSEPLAAKASLNITLCVLVAIEALSNVKMCHADIKPGNIMLGPDGSAILIDLASTVPYGSTLIEYTDAYCLKSRVASLKVDLICLATTIAHILFCQVPDFKSITDLKESLNNYSDNLMAVIALACLDENASPASVWKTVVANLQSNFYERNSLFQTREDVDYMWNNPYFAK